MTLDLVIVALLATLALAALPLSIVVGGRLPPAQASRWLGTRLAALLLAALLVLLALRSRDFGVDTQAYAEFFFESCRRGVPWDAETGFVLSAWLLDAAMGGLCSVALLPAAWALLVVLGLLAVAGPAEFRLRFAALALFSLVGIELTTNALRQGLAAAATVVAVSCWPQRRLRALAIAGAAVALHASAGLVLLAYAAATLGWRGFVVALAAAAGGVVWLLERGLEPALLAPLLYEIQKYLAHPDEELWIRVLSFACVLAVLAAAPLAARGAAARRAVRQSPAYGQALRLAATALPLLLVPYFGYRYVYGIFPVVLWLTMRAAEAGGARAGRHLALLLALDGALLLAWSLGSAVMRETPFLE